MPFTTRAASRKLAVTVVAALIAALAVPAIAGAQQRAGPTVDQYETTLGQIEGETGAAGAGPGTPGDSDDGTAGLSGRVGPLPFTGFDVIAMVAVALGVTGLGLALQRAVSRPPSDGLS